MSTRMRTGWVAAVAALSCTACTSSLFDSELPVPSAYVIASARGGTVTGAPSTPVDISIGRPDFSPGLDSERIAVLKGRELDYFRGVRWGGRTVEVVQNMLVATMNDQQLFRSVTAEQSRVANDYTLDVEVRNFEAEYAQGPTPDAHVMIIGRLIRVADRRLVATVSSDARVSATEDRMSAVAAAFEGAAQKVAVDLTRQTAVAVAEDQPALRKLRGESNEPRPE